MSRQEEKLILPEPLKVKPSISRYLDKLEEDGKTIWAFGGTDIIENIFYLHLMNKYKSKCLTWISDLNCKFIRSGHLYLLPSCYLYYILKFLH